MITPSEIAECPILIYMFIDSMCRRDKSTVAHGTPGVFSPFTPDPFFRLHSGMTDTITQMRADVVLLLLGVAFDLYLITSLIISLHQSHQGKTSYEAPVQKSLQYRRTATISHNTCIYSIRCFTSFQENKIMPVRI